MGIKKIFSLGVFTLFSLSAMAQIQLSPCVVGEWVNEYPSVESSLKQRLHAVVTNAGMASTEGGRFVLAAKADVLQQEVVPVAPPLHQLHLQVSVGIGDGFDGTCYGTQVIEVKGQGQSVEKAYINALKAIKANSPELAALCQNAKANIIAYYDANAKAIMAQANQCVANNDYDQALYLLSGIPQECKSYNEAASLITSVYRKSVNYNSDKVVSAAEAKWAANPSEANADAVMAILADVEPGSSAYSRAQTLKSKVEARILTDKANERADRNAELKRQHATEQARIKGIRDAAVAYAKNQPKVVYNTSIIHWW